MRGVMTVYIANFVNTHAGCTTIILKFGIPLQSSFWNILYTSAIPGLQFPEVWIEERYDRLTKQPGTKLTSQCPIFWSEHETGHCCTNSHAIDSVAQRDAFDKRHLYGALPLSLWRSARPLTQTNDGCIWYLKSFKCCEAIAEKRYWQPSGVWPDNTSWRVTITRKCTQTL
jgi:hypothetical protein